MKEKALLLISAGIDSPVAGIILKKKFDLIGVHFNNEPLTDNVPVENAKRLCKIIGLKELYIVKHGLLIQTEILKKANRRYGCVICRRMMFRIANKIAEKEKCKYLITGENLGQVASQTLDNLSVTDDVSDKIILRPLLSYDKNEIVKLAKKFGTYDISTEPSICCSAVPKHPLTKAKLEKVRIEEERMDVDQMVESSLKDVIVIKI